jgi:hypothetical protein
MQRRSRSPGGAAWWLFNRAWPELIHPFASVIDTPLPIRPDHTHLMPAYKAPWNEVDAKRKDKQFDEYPEESTAQRLERLGLTLTD